AVPEKAKGAVAAAEGGRGVRAAQQAELVGVDHPLLKNLVDWHGSDPVLPLLQPATCRRPRAGSSRPGSENLLTVMFAIAILQRCFLTKRFIGQELSHAVADVPGL